MRKIINILLMMGIVSAGFNFSTTSDWLDGTRYNISYGSGFPVKTTYLNYFTTETCEDNINIECGGLRISNRLSDNFGDAHRTNFTTNTNDWKWKYYETEDSGGSHFNEVRFENGRMVLELMPHEYWTNEIYLEYTNAYNVMGIAGDFNVTIDFMNYNDSSYDNVYFGVMLSDSNDIWGGNNMAVWVSTEGGVPLLIDDNSFNYQWEGNSRDADWGKIRFERNASNYLRSYVWNTTSNNSWILVDEITSGWQLLDTHLYFQIYGSAEGVNGQTRKTFIEFDNLLIETTEPDNNAWWHSSVFGSQATAWLSPNITLNNNVLESITVNYTDNNEYNFLSNVIIYHNNTFAGSKDFSFETTTTNGTGVTLYEENFTWESGYSGFEDITGEFQIYITLYKSNIVIDNQGVTITEISGEYKDPDFEVITTDDFNLGSKTNTTTSNDRYNQSDDSIELDYPMARKDSELIGYWRLEEGEGTIASNEKGVLNGTIYRNATTNNPIWMESPFGFGTYHYDIGDHITISSVYMPNPTQLTYLYHYKANSTADISTFFSDGGQSTTSGYIWYFRSGATAYYQYAIGGTRSQAACSIYTDTNWHAYALTVDYTNKITTFYKDGNMICNVTTTNNMIPPDGVHLYIGNYNPTHSYDLEGIIDEIKITKRFMSSDEITEAYNSFKKYKVFGSWESKEIQMTEGKQISSTTFEYEVNENNFISKIEWLVDNETKAVYDENITSGTTVTITESNLTSGSFEDVDENFTIKVYLQGNGTHTPALIRVHGMYKKCAYGEIILSDIIIDESETFINGEVELNATITCIGGKCFTINAFSRYGNSSADTVIPSSGDFFSTGNNPQTCYLKSGNKCNVSFVIKAHSDGEYYIDILASSVILDIANNSSEEVMIKVLKANPVTCNIFINSNLSNFTNYTDYNVRITSGYFEESQVNFFRVCYS